MHLNRVKTKIELGQSFKIIKQQLSSKKVDNHHHQPMNTKGFKIPFFMWFELSMNKQTFKTYLGG